MISARGLCRAESLGLTLVAGAQGADRNIGWAHAIELADPTPYLAGGELVMTTGINIGADAAAQADYVARLAAAGTAALAVDTGTTLTAVPPVSWPPEIGGASRCCACRLRHRSSRSLAS